MNQDDHLIFEQYMLLKEGLEGKMQYLLKLVPSDIQNKEQYVRDVADQYDPSPEKSYTQWILKMMMQKHIRGEEDREDVVKILKMYMDAKLRKKLSGKEADINTFNSPGQLNRFMAEKLGERMTKREKLQIEQRKGVQKIAEHGDMELYAVTNQEAGNNLFQETGWCVKDPDYWNQYREEDDTELYYMIYKHGMDKIKREGQIFDTSKHRLVNFASNQYKDVYDDEVEPTPEEMQLFLKARQFVESHEPENLNSKYVSFFTKTNQEIPENVIEIILNKKYGSQDAMNIYLMRHS